MYYGRCNYTDRDKKVPKDTLLMSFKLSLGKVAITAADIYTNEAIIAFIDKKHTM